MVDALSAGDRLISWTWWWTAYLCLCQHMKRRCTEVGVSASHPYADPRSSCWPRPRTAQYHLPSNQVPVTAQTLQISAQIRRLLTRTRSHVLWTEDVKEKHGPRTLHFLLKRTTNFWVCELTFSLLIVSSLCHASCLSVQLTLSFKGFYLNMFFLAFILFEWSHVTEKG